MELFYYISEHILLFPFALILIGSIFLTFHIRFVQIRFLPKMFSMLFSSIFQKNKSDHTHAIQAHKALFTAMSTTIGIGNIAGPIIAIGLGGPSALVGFMLATIFGCATTFVEVSLALAYRKRHSDGTIQGGPMQYLHGIHPFLGQLYAWAGFFLLVAWSGAQSNTLAVLLKPYGISEMITGGALAITMLLILFGGIKRIGDLNEKLVPTMFLLYCGAMLWIFFQHIGELPNVVSIIYHSIISPETLAGATLGASVQQGMRHGLARALQANEAGVGTATFPHSMAETEDPIQQGILAMVSVYSNGFLCLLTGFVILMTGAWQDKSAAFDINMLVKTMELHFSGIGPLILTVCAFLFAFGTILGNAYNGSQCYLYATKNRWLNVYYVLAGLSVFLGAIFGVKFVWTVIDYFILPVAIPHMISLIILVIKKKNLFRSSS